MLESFKKTKTRKVVITPKFYYFDVGVSNLLTGRDKIAKGTPEYGKAMEHFVFNELIAYKDYRNQQFELFYWRLTSQFEVDFILQLKSKKLIGIEVKASFLMRTRISWPNFCKWRVVLMNKSLILRRIS